MDGCLGTRFPLHLHMSLRPVLTYLIYSNTWVCGPHLYSQTNGRLNIKVCTTYMFAWIRGRVAVESMRACASGCICFDTPASAQKLFFNLFHLLQWDGDSNKWQKTVWTSVLFLLSFVWELGRQHCWHHWRHLFFRSKRGG